MACFLAPTTVAIAISAAKKKISPQCHVEWLLAMLWGGVAWLIPEHIYHGEVVFYPPFFTARLSEIIPEILTVGVPMVIATVAMWVIILVIYSSAKKIAQRPLTLGLMVFGAALMILVDKIFS